MSRPWSSLVLVFLASICVGFAAPVFANSPEIRNVVVYKIGSSVYLNITIYHTPENLTHYVNIVRVSIYVEDNYTDLSIGPQPLSPDGTFTIPYDVGPISGGETYAQVDAHCTQGYWSVTSWWGNIPEFSLPIMLVALTLSTSLATLALRKARLATSKRTSKLH